MKVLVTGATGHVGANLVRRLLADGKDEIRVLLRDGRDHGGVDGLDVERAYGDVRDLDAMRKAVKGVDRVFHVAAMISTVIGGEREIYDINVIGSRNVFQAAREAKVGLDDIDVVADLDTDADEADLAKLAELTERYCVVAQSLASPVHLTIRRAAGAGR